MEIKTFLRLPTDCFGTGSEHKLNLLRRPSRARGSKWMSGSANAGTTAERHQMCELKILTKKVRALASAPGHVCFSLTEDLHGCRSAARRSGDPISARIEKLPDCRQYIQNNALGTRPDGARPNPNAIPARSSRIITSFLAV
jgi:hypothetical protein